MRLFENIGKITCILILLLGLMELLARYAPRGAKYNILTYSSIPTYLPDNWNIDKYTKLRKDLMNVESASDDFLGSYFKSYSSETVNIIGTYGVSKRLTWNPVESSSKEKNTSFIDIYFFGGSTMFGHGVSDFETIPSYVSKILYDKYNINANMSNFGRIGYVSTEEFLLFSYLAPQKGNRKKTIAVFLSGLNDIVSVNFFASDNPDKRMGNSIIARIKKKNSSLTQHSNLIKALSSFFTNKLFNNSFSKISISDQDEIEVESNYKRNVSNILSIAKDNNFIPIFYWQPLSAYKTIKTFYEQNPQYVPKVEYRKNVNIDYKYYYNISHFFENTEEPIFLDFCHYSERGNELIAERIVSDILEVIKKENVN